ncbi:serine/threonine-protein kinase [Nesterenkonia haasae]|uniref:serine/threonine-protein kinase n=1 Tax=Nesterenkonia haasae TaxID=2587813 RepID=UPI00139078A6|nr:serine/threonine-protein kinase [Nesterenkonia haasae]NDK31240.1 serine/threonine protein kinase [Nesterenkonia haasae]
MAERLGHYLLGDVIGVGSFATVYRAIDERLDDEVVVKVLAENHSLNPEIRERFIAEGRSLRRVEGSHVVTIYDIGESERQQPYLVLEYADRGTVRERVAALWQSGWRASREDILAFARPLAAAVDAVHRAQLVHRDLSPGNILLTTKPSELIGDETSNLHSQVVATDERLMIADLGMCKNLAMNSGLTVSGGTAGFRPPEQDSPGVVDTRADIYAISAVLNWLAQDADLPGAADKVIRRGMSAKPHRRQPNASVWLNELEDALAPPESAPEREPAAESTQDAPPTTWVGLLRRRFVVVLLLVAFAGGALLGGTLLGQWLSGGQEQSAAEAGGATIGITGPEEVTVGESAVFNAEVSDLESWVWALPSGRHLADEPEVLLTPTAPGTAEIVLRARLPDGQDLEARHSIRVIE